MNPSGDNQAAKVTKKVSGQEDKVTARIKAVRHEKKISQVDMAEKLGMERSNYYRLENRGENLTVTQLQKIADVLGVSALSFLSENLVEISSATREADQLRKRVRELEDRLGDKEKLLNNYYAANDEIQRSLVLEIVSAAVDLNLTSWPDKTLLEDESIWENWGHQWMENRFNDKGELTLVFGPPTATITLYYADINRVYDYFEKSDPGWYKLFNEIVSSIFWQPNSLIRRVAMARFLKESYPKGDLDKMVRFGLE